MSKATSPRRKNTLTNRHCYHRPPKSAGISSLETSGPVFIDDLIRNIDADIDLSRVNIISILKYDPHNFQRLRKNFTRFTGLLYRQWFLSQINEGTSVAVTAAATLAWFLDRVMPACLERSREAYPELSQRQCCEPNRAAYRECLLWGDSKTTPS